jgi:DNA-binding response OmpR family regulator
MTKILVIDDERDIRDLLRYLLESKGYEVLEAGNGEDGLRVFQRTPADLVMTDILMPDKEGLATIIDLKKKYPHLKIIAMSGASKSDHYLSFARKLGADKILEKPFNLQTVMQAIEELLS